MTTYTRQTAADGTKRKTKNSTPLTDQSCRSALAFIAAMQLVKAAIRHSHSIRVTPDDFIAEFPDLRCA